MIDAYGEGWPTDYVEQDAFDRAKTKWHDRSWLSIFLICVSGAYAMDHYFWWTRLEWVLSLGFLLSIPLLIGINMAAEGIGDWAGRRAVLLHRYGPSRQKMR
ncbi:hypothetical protein DEM26_08900 [Thioclava sp. NG1]|nr:hypothetical protein DEM26_08900 [Thioclava sp. NG1]